MFSQASVILSTEGVCMAKGGVHGEGMGACVEKGSMYGKGGHAWQGACVVVEECMAGGMHGREHAWQGGMCGKGGKGGHAWQERRPLQRMVSILLECILVELWMLSTQDFQTFNSSWSFGVWLSLNEASQLKDKHKTFFHPRGIPYILNVLYKVFLVLFKKKLT